jgi:hypothetical protein
MHLAPADLRSVRQDGLAIRFGILGPIAYALAEVLDPGSAGTVLELPCARPHWGFVLAGDVTLHQGGTATVLPVGHAFHVRAGGPEHHFEASPGAVVAGFEAVRPDVDASEAALVARGYEILQADEAGTRIVPTTTSLPIESGHVDADAHLMSNLVLSRVRMGTTSGFTAQWCDAEHWGMVAAGRVAIEWEDDIEVLGTGDIYYCPPGPPGHRISAADPATIVDLTPMTSLETVTRLADWRRPMLELARRPGAAGPVALAALT